MRRILVLLAVVVVLVGVAASSTTAALSNLRITVDGQAQFVSPTTLQLPVTYVCPASFVSAGLSVSVSQAETGAQGSGFQGVNPCTGAPRTVVVTITAFTGTWVLGPALANGFVFTGVESDQQRRRIQIVL